MKQLAANLSEEHDTLLRFNSLLIDISTIFISLPVDQIDSKIEEAQHRICTFLDLDRSTLWRFDEQEEATLWLTHTYQPAGSLQPPSPMNCIDYFPWLLRKLMDGETVVISNMTELPAEAVRDRESFNLFNSKSGVFIPLSVGQGPLLGVLTFAAMREERDWNENLVDGFIVVAQMFANAIAHKQHEMSLRESEARLILTTNAAGAGLWNMLTDTGSVWVSKKTRDLFHFASDEEISDASFYKVMHPEDRQPMKQIVQQAIQTGETFSCEYRIVLPDGTIRWIAARGQLHHGSGEGLDQLLGVAIDITEGKQSELRQEEQLHFETLLVEISARFVNLSADRLDGEIGDALNRIATLLNLDLVALWQSSTEKGEGPLVFKPTHMHPPVGDLKPLEITEEQFPWYKEQILSGKIPASLPLKSCRPRRPRIGNSVASLVSSRICASLSQLEVGGLLASSVLIPFRQNVIGRRSW